MSQAILLANPIYDTVFKYLMEDLDIAKGILSAILNTEIEQISVQPQETTTITASENRIPVSIYRLDFIALIKQPDGTHKKVLIELQKTKRSTVISRFRRYLGENYQREDSLLNDPNTTQPLEIITIYFLGFPLEDISVPVLKVKNCYIDVLNDKPLDTEPKHKFVRLLNHESYTIQLTKLEGKNRTQLERLLRVFDQKYKYAFDAHFVEYPEDATTQDPLLSKVINRLLKVNASPELLRQLNLEDDVEKEFETLQSQLAQTQAQLNEKNNEITEKDEQITKKDTQLNEKDTQLTQKDIQLAEKDKLIEMLLKKIKDEDKT